MNLKQISAIIIVIFLLSACSNTLTPHQAAFGAKCGQRLK